MESPLTHEPSQLGLSRPEVSSNREGSGPLPVSAMSQPARDETRLANEVSGDLDRKCRAITQRHLRRRFPQGGPYLDRTSSDRRS